MYSRLELFTGHEYKDFMVFLQWTKFAIVVDANIYRESNGPHL